MKLIYAIVSTLVATTVSSLAVRQVGNDDRYIGIHIRIRSSDLENWDGKYVNLKKVGNGVAIAVAETNRGTPSFAKIRGALLYSGSPIIIGGASASNYIGAFSNRNTAGQYIKPLYFVQDDRSIEFTPHLTFELQDGSNTLVSRDNSGTLQSWWVCKGFRPTGMSLARLDVIAVSIDPEDPMNESCVRIYLEKV